MSDVGKEIFIKSVLPLEQREDSLLFEMSFTDAEGNAFKSRFFVRNHNVGLFNMAISKMRPITAASVSHTPPRGPASGQDSRASNNTGGQSCP